MGHFERRSSQSISWHSTEDSKPNTTKANKKTTVKTHKMLNLNKCTKN